MIYLLDNNLSGHHKVYLEALKEIKDTKDICVEKNLEGRKWHYKYFLDRVLYLKTSLEMVKDKDILHILYLDLFYTVPFVSKLIKSKSVIGTLHHIPHNKIKQKLLRLMAKDMKYIVVHSEFSKRELFKIGIKNVAVIDYPSFFDYSKFEKKEILKEKMNISKNFFIISALGGTRADKGLDVLLESFKYIEKSIKDKILLNIVGKEETYKKQFIEKKSKEYGIKIRLKLGFVEDDEFCKNILITDCMVMPYRKIFTGNSGPMTEAIVNNIPCIAPKEIMIGEMVEEYKLGLTYEVNNEKKLGEIIEKIVEYENERNNLDFTKNYFLLKYREIYY